MLLGDRDEKIVLAATIFGCFQLYANEDVIVSENMDSASCAGACAFEGIYFGVGGGYAFSEDTAYIVNGPNASKNINRFMGSLLLGSGKSMNAHPIYFGIETLVDIAKTSSENIYLNQISMKLKNAGIIPSLGLRIAYLKPNTDLLIFGKVGAAYTKSSMEYSGRKVSVSKFAPIFAVGFEKAICRKYTTRFDLEYRMKTDNSDNVYKIENGHCLNMRVTFIHNVKF